MKIKRNENVEEVLGVKEENKFKISNASQGVVIHSLINLYSDPIGSIVREITSNCIDAHRERNLKKAGTFDLSPEDDIQYWSTRESVDIKYIDSNTILGIEAHMIFKDYGIGLSPDRVKEVFTVFGQSTKRNNDLEIGGFGLGAKSPLAYVDTFYVKTIHNLTEYYYMIYIGNDDVPSMDLVKSNPTKNLALNCCEIIVPLKNTDDKSKFRDAIQDQIMFFDNVNLNGIEELGSIEAPVRLEETDKYIITQSKDYDECKLLIGKVAYDINWDLLFPGQNRWDDDYEKIERGLILKFDIGVLDLVPSREDVRYTPNTIDIIVKRVRSLREKFKQEAVEYYEQETDFIQFLKSSSSVSTNRAYNYTQRHSSDIMSVKANIARLQKNDLKFDGCEFYKERFNKFTIGTRLTKVYRVSDSNAPGGYRIVKTKVSDWSMLSQYPIYVRSGNFSRKKDWGLLEEVGKDFITVYIPDHDLVKIAAEEDSLTFDGGKTARTTDQIIKDANRLFKWFEDSALSGNYDDVKEDDLLDDNIGVTMSKKEMRILNKQLFFRQAETKASICPWADCSSENSKFFNVEYKLEDIDALANDEDAPELIIYGFTEDNIELLKLNSMLSCRKDHNFRIFKISKALANDFEPYVNIKDFYMNQHPALRNFCTGVMCEEYVEKYNYLNGFKLINGDIYDTFIEVKIFSQDQLSNQSYLGKSKIVEEILELCKNEGILNEDMVENMAILDEYCKGLNLLTGMVCLTDGQRNSIKEFEKDIALFLDSKEKKHYIEDYLPKECEPECENLSY